MADLFLDIRDRHIRAIVTDNGIVRLQKTYPLKPAGGKAFHAQTERAADTANLLEGELQEVLALIRSDSGFRCDNVHVIIPTEDVRSDIHVLPHMPQQEAHKILTRKTTAKTGDENIPISPVPKALVQNNQTWLVEYVATDLLKSYRKEFSTARLKLKTVTTALDATLHAFSSIRDSIFNAHAIFEVNTHSIEAYYISSSSLLLHETLELDEPGVYNGGTGDERTQKRRMFTILDLLYRINSQYLSAHPMNPLQKVWLCGTDASIPELASALPDTIGIETSVLSDEMADTPGMESGFVALKGLQKAFFDGELINLMHHDLLRRFPLRKKSGMLVYIGTTILAAVFFITTEYRHSQLKKQAAEEKKVLAAQKISQAASAAFAKNLDMFRKLAGGQIMFYPIFKELAMNLPDRVYLDTFHYSSKDNHDTIEISATFPQSSDLGTQKTLTRLMELTKKSPYLNRYREPSVISATKELNKTVTVRFICEVHPRDTAK